jgi:hypothetical protein
MTGLHNGVLDNSLWRKRIEVMVGQQLIAKGLQQVGLEDHSDLPVHFLVGVKDKQRVESTGVMGGVPMVVGTGGALAIMVVTGLPTSIRKAP